MSAARTCQHLIICRPEFSAAVRDEGVAGGGQARIVVPGLVAADRLPSAPLIFEHQRMPASGFIPAADLKPISDATWHTVMDKLQAAQHRWTLHAWAIPNDQQARVDGVANTLLRLARKLGPRLDDLFRPPHRAEKMDDALVLQLCLTSEGLWHSTAPMSDLSCRQPGGAVRMKDDPLAPSRSYLKMEEAFHRLGEWPVPGQRVVDLGAAPGGWTLAFAKRGCHVIAVDNGPLKLPAPGPGWGTIEHRMTDGLTYMLPPDSPPVDWLVADMLVPPARATDMLRAWLQRPAMRRWVINIKLPQGSPLTALRPLQQLLAQHGEFRSSMRHLYHDREEITLLGQGTGI
jgi:23S rRNA C2498 (ribose-2'-O)-methylase RlmM